MPKAVKASVVIESKLYPGVGAASVMPREQLRLPAELAEGRKNVAVISAAAGYGKSTVMSGWHQQLSENGAACGWLSLDEKDNDPARLMRHLVAAIGSAVAGRQKLIDIGADFGGGWRPALEALASELGALRKSVTLFLDDVHLLDEGDARQIIDWLINYGPEACRLVIGTREAGRLRLGKLRVRGRIIELTEHDLRFSDDETAQFLAQRMGHDLQSADVRALASKTEGWPAALELAGLAIRSGADTRDVIENFSGRDMNVVDYLGEVVADHLDADTRNFILHLAQFDRFCAELAEQVSPARNAEHRLAALHEANLFLTPLDRKGHWYRFHQLAGDFLRSRFARDIGDPRETIMTGARWLMAHGHAEDAINAAIRARDWETASRWIAECSDEIVYRRGYLHTIMQWMRQLPEQWVDRFPDIRIHYAFALTFSPHRNQVAGQLQRLAQIRERLLAADPPDAQLAERIECEIEIQNLTLRAINDDGVLALHEGRRLLARWPDAALTRRASLGNILTFGLKTIGEIDEGLAMAEQTRAWCEQGEAWYSLAWIEYLTALLHLKRGNYLDARTTAQNALHVVRERMGGHPAHEAMLHAVLATVTYEFDETAAAREHVDRSVSLLEEGGHADAVILAFLAAAKLDHLTRDEAAGIARLRHGQSLGERVGLNRVTVTLAAEECNWHARSGRLEEARSVARRFGFGDLKTGKDWNLQSEKAALVASRFRLRTEPADVIRQLRTPIERCREKGLHRRWVDLLLLKATAHRVAGEKTQAAGAAIEALNLAAPRNYVRAFLDEAEELRETFELIDMNQLRGSDAAPLARRVLAAMRERGGSARSESMVEQLSKRETAILKRLESDLSNKEIADAIFISEGTLKWHLHNIYGKLAVKNRAGALTRARALALI